MKKNIYVKNVDIELLRKQRDFLLINFKDKGNSNVNGLVNLLDNMLDIAEGYKYEEV